MRFLMKRWIEQENRFAKNEVSNSDSISSRLKGVDFNLIHWFNKN